MSELSFSDRFFSDHPFRFTSADAILFLKLSRVFWRVMKQVSAPWQHVFYFQADVSIGNLSIISFCTGISSCKDQPYTRQGWAWTSCKKLLLLHRHPASQHALVRELWRPPRTTPGKGFVSPISINFLTNLVLGAYVGSSTGLALAAPQNFTQSRRRESPGTPLGLNTSSHNKCELRAVLTDILQKGENVGKRDPLCINNSWRWWRTMKRGSCKGPEQIFTHKILNQHKGQSNPFFQIPAKLHFLLSCHCLVPFPTAWGSSREFSPQGSRDTTAPCYTWGWRHRERKDQAHVLRCRQPKVCHPGLN